MAAEIWALSVSFLSTGKGGKKFLHSGIVLKGTHRDVKQVFHSDESTASLGGVLKWSLNTCYFSWVETPYSCRKLCQGEATQYQGDSIHCKVTSWAFCALCVSLEDVSLSGVWQWPQCCACSRRAVPALWSPGLGTATRVISVPEESGCQM